MNVRTIAAVFVTPVFFASCSTPWQTSAPNGEAILRAEKIREAPVSQSGTKTVSAAEFRKDWGKVCAGEICVDTAFPSVGSGSSMRQATCSTMGGTEYLAPIPEGLSDGTVSDDAAPKCDRLALVSIDFDTKNVKITERNGKWSRFEEVSKIPGGYAAFSKTSWCGWAKWSQKILSDAGSEIIALPKTESVPPYPEILTIGEKEFKAQDLSSNDQTYYLWSFLKTEEFPRTLSVKDDVSAEFEKYVLERSFLAESYLFTFAEYPGLRVKYLTKTTPSERIVRLGSDARVSKIVQPVTDSLLDAKLTERILKDYVPEESERVLIPLGTSKEKALGPEAAFDKRLRIVPFRVDRFDKSGNFLLYSNTDYEFVSFGDACVTGLDDGYRKPLE